MPLSKNEQELDEVKVSCPESEVGEVIKLIWGVTTSFPRLTDVIYGRYDGIPLKDLLLRTRRTYDTAKADYIETSYESNKSKSKPGS